MRTASFSVLIYLPTHESKGLTTNFIDFFKSLLPILQNLILSPFFQWVTFFISFTYQSAYHRVDSQSELNQGALLLLFQLDERKEFNIFSKLRNAHTCHTFGFVVCTLYVSTIQKLNNKKYINTYTYFTSRQILYSWTRIIKMRMKYTERRHTHRSNIVKKCEMLCIFTETVFYC